jgi:hypothetical protein
MPSLRYELPLEFGDDHTRRKYETRCNNLRATQTAQYVVAPLMTVKTRDGRLLTEGQEVRVSDFEHLPERTETSAGGSKTLVRSLTPAAQLAALIRRGVVLEASWTTGPEAA